MGGSEYVCDTLFYGKISQLQEQTAEALKLQTTATSCPRSADTIYPHAFAFFSAVTLGKLTGFNRDATSVKAENSLWRKVVFLENSM
jgi:hypothetical protein